MRSSGFLDSFEAGLDALPEPPHRVLDLGTGTGAGALAIARRFGEADVIGVDLSEEMVARARRNLPADLAHRVGFDRADASDLPFEDASFDLVTHANMIPFFDELARVTAGAAHVVVAFSNGPKTPIYLPTERLRVELERHGFDGVRELVARPGTAVVARRRMGDD
jgi:SAM-dependent methyltransferase